MASGCASGRVSSPANDAAENCVESHAERPCEAARVMVNDPACPCDAAVNGCVHYGLVNAAGGTGAVSRELPSGNGPGGDGCGNHVDEGQVVKIYVVCV